MTADGSSALDVAIGAAEAAAAVIEQRLPDTMGPGASERLGISTKGSWNDRVTEVDSAAESAALAVLQRSFPSHTIVAEESGTKDKDSPSAGTSTLSTERGISPAGCLTSASALPSGLTASHSSAYCSTLSATKRSQPPRGEVRP